MLYFILKLEEALTNDYNLHKLAPFAPSGDSEFDEPSGTNEPDSGDKSDLAIAKRLRT